MNPPVGATLQTDLINKYFPISFLSYDISSLFAGKLHALLSRQYTKGRDLYDLGWYLSKWKDIKPNIILLNNALTQTEFEGKKPTLQTWRQQIHQAVQKLDWEIVRKDMERFLENPSDMDIFTKEAVLSLLSK